MSAPGERIYGSVDARDIGKAAKHFQHAMIDEDSGEFFRRINARWESALMQPTARAGKAWLWDCDTPESYEQTIAALPLEVVIYQYESVSGRHVITRPFDRRGLPPLVAGICKDNAMMLWAFDPLSTTK